MRNFKAIAAIALLAVTLVVFAGCTSKLDEAKAAAVDSLNQAVNLEDYREDEQGDIADIIKDYEAKINEQESEEDVSTVLDEGIAKLKKVKTDAELTKEEEKKKAEEEAAKKKAEEEYQQYLYQQQQQQQQTQNNSGGNSNKNSDGCVDDSAKNFY